MAIGSQALPVNPNRGLDFLGRHVNLGGAGLEGDLWLNTPVPPSEASCTGGIAALNGVVNVSG